MSSGRFRVGHHAAGGQSNTTWMALLSVHGIVHSTRTRASGKVAGVMVPGAAPRLLHPHMMPRKATWVRMSRIKLVERELRLSGVRSTRTSHVHARHPLPGHGVGSSVRSGRETGVEHMRLLIMGREVTTRC